MTTKEKILDLLKNNANDYISGQELADRLFVTRAGIWKAIKALQKEGYNIEAVTNKGYRLISDTDELTKTGVDNWLKEYGVDFKTLVFDEVDSTNNVVKDMADRGEAGEYVAIAGYQTNGRGRRGRAFFSPKGTGVYFSFLLHPDMAISQATGLTCMAAVAVCKGIKKAFGIDVSIKWVNDIFYEERKICGILTEGFTSIEDGSLSYVVVGIGINVYEPQGGFPKEIKKIAGSVFKYGEKAQDNRNRLAAAVISEFLSFYSNPSLSYIDEYRERSFLIGSYVQINSNNPDLPKEYARVTGIDEECRLLVEYDDGTKKALSNGEVSVVKY